MSTVTLDVPREHWWTANDRLHWSQKAKRTKWVREATRLAARAAGTYQTANIDAYIAYPRNNRADPANVAATVLKAAIDGLVDAGILPDDDSEHLPAITIRRDPPTGQTGLYRIRLVLTQPEGTTP